MQYYSVQSKNEIVSFRILRNWKLSVTHQLMLPFCSSCFIFSSSLLPITGKRNHSAVMQLAQFVFNV